MHWTHALWGFKNNRQRDGTSLWTMDSLNYSHHHLPRALGATDNGHLKNPMNDFWATEATCETTRLFGQDGMSATQVEPSRCRCYRDETLRI